MYSYCILWQCALSPTSIFGGKLFFGKHCFSRRLLWLLEGFGQDAEEACNIFSESKNNGTLECITNE